MTVAVVDSAMTFTGSKANAAGVKTELLLQKLASRARRTYAEKYRTSFVAFATGGLTTKVTAGAGYYAVAYRFVSTATGKETGIVPLGMVSVV